MKKEKSIFYAVYTALFAAMTVAVFGWFYFNGKSLLADGDAWRQHIRAVALYSKWLRGVFYHLIHDHSLQIQTFAFGMGYGSDLYPTLQYYALGDPLNLFSVFCPTNYIYYYFQIVMILRGFIAGITFSAFCFYMRKDASKVAIMTATFVYVFCGTFMYLGIWHPFFANPLIYLPLVIMGVEKILRDRKPLMFMISVLLSSVCSFYFFYMIVLITIIYTLIRVIYINRKDVKAIVITLGKFLGYGIIGTLMSMMVLMPVMYLFSINPRVATEVSFGIFFDADYYYELMRNLITFVYYPQYDTALSYNFMSLLVVIFLCIRCRKKIQQFIMLLIFAMFLVIPVFGYILGGFAYTTGRWSFAVSMFVAFMVVDLWDGLLSIKLHESVIMAIVTIIYWRAATAFHQVISYPNMQKELLFAGAGIAVITIISQIRKRLSEDNSKKVFVLGTIFIAVMSFAGIITNAYYAYSPEQGNMIAGYFDIETGEEFYNRMQTSEVQATEVIEGDTKDDFYRYTGKNLVWNASILDGISSTQYFWSLANGVVSDYFMEMAVNDQQNFAYLALDDRTILNTLAGVKYYTLPYDIAIDYAYVPYEYTKQEGETGDYVVFENDNTLPLGYTYYETISSQDYQNMTPYQRQEALLYGCVVNDESVDTTGILDAEFDYTAQSLEYEMTVGDGIKVNDDGSFKVKEEGATITFTFEGLPMSETYLYFKNLWVTNKKISTTNINVNSYIADTIVTSKKLYYIMDDCQFYSNWHDYMVNTGFTADGQTSITISFDNKGTYTFDSIEIVCQPMDSYDTQLESLNSSTLQNVDLHKNPISKTTNLITGDVTTTDTGILCLTIPYSSGWTAYVDGVKTDIFQLNTMFMGIKLEAGEHEIELRYHTPGLMAGWILSIIGLALCIVVVRKTKVHGSN